MNIFIGCMVYSVHAPRIVALGPLGPFGPIVANSHPLGPIGPILANSHPLGPFGPILANSQSLLYYKHKTGTTIPQTNIISTNK